MPVEYVRRSGLTAPTGRKGRSRLFRWIGSNRATGDTLGLTTTDARIVVNQVAIPWQQNTAPVV